MKSKVNRTGRSSIDVDQSSVESAEEKTEPIVCPVCGAVAVQEKCKVICRSELCRGRVILNCSEF
jgi:hypothetical protein